MPSKPGLKGKNSIWFELLLKRLYQLHQIEYFSQLVYESNINITLGFSITLAASATFIDGAKCVPAVITD
jgi:hypothetical protein